MCVFIGFFFELFVVLLNFVLILFVIECYYVINNFGRKKIFVKVIGKLIFVVSILVLIFVVLWIFLEGSLISGFDFIGLSLICFLLLSFYKIEILWIFNIVYLVMCFLFLMVLMVVLFVKMIKLLWIGFYGVWLMGIGNISMICFFVEIKIIRILFIILVFYLCCWFLLCIILLYLFFWL